MAFWVDAQVCPISFEVILEICLVLMMRELLHPAFQDSDC